MAESLAASQIKAGYQKRTSFHRDDCESGKRKGITNEVRGKFESAKCDRYVSLHHHSTYSFLDGFALPEAHVRRASEIGMGSLALTEHGNISSHVKLEKAALAMGVKPIFGCEVYMGPVSEAKRGQRKFHLTVLAATQQGYINLMGLVSLGWKQFYYEPTVSYNDLVRFKEGLIILSGCTGSLLACSTIGGKTIDPTDASYERGKQVAARFKADFGDAYYMEVQAFPELDAVKKINKMYERMSGELGIELVGTGDVHYTKPSENEMQKILHNVRGGNRKTLEEMSREWGYDVPLCPPTSDTYMLRRLYATGLSKQASMAALQTTHTIASRCNVTLPKMGMIEFPVPWPYFDVKDVWKAWLRDGWAFRDIPGKVNVGDYVTQLRYEAKIIEDKGFMDYFLMVSDVVKFAKDQQIPVGPARGSVAASLVAYLLRITEVDPLAFPNLLFERFIEPNRKDLPDIDLDFDDRRRHEIREYLVSKYGEAQVGNVGTFTTYKSKLSLDDVGRVYRIPKYAIETVKELLLERSSGDLRADATIEDTAEMFEAVAAVFEQFPELKNSIELEGQVKGMGVHAAGLVVASGPLTNSCATYSRVVKGRTVSVLSVDKYDAEYLNVLKIDVLGLTTLGMISRCLEMIGKPLSWLYEIPLDDRETLNGFQANDVVGVFQFDGRAMRGVTAELKPESFLEVCDITALARPGPLHNGAAAEYIDVKNGTRKAREYHPLVNDIVAHTHGQIVYQEQILRVCGEIGGFDHVHRATIRKIISKKLGEQEFNRWWLEFWKGAEERGLTEDEAKQIWNSCITAGSYAFNQSHALGYGMLAWWCVGGQTRIYDWDKAEYISIAKAYREGITHTASYDPVTGKTVKAKVAKVVRTTGAKKTDLKFGWKLTTQSMKRLVCSERHLILTPEGYRRLEELNVGDLVAAEKRHSVAGDPSVREKISIGKRASWARSTEESRAMALRGLDRSRGSGVATWKKTWDSLTPNQKAAKVRPWIDAAANSHGRLGVGLCGQQTHCQDEEEICRWMTENEIVHDHQVPHTNGISDFKVKGVFVECDNMRQGSRYWEVKYGDEPYQVTNGRKFKDDLHWLLEEEAMRSGDEIGWERIKSIEPVGDMVMYDLALEDNPHNFLANGIVVHNTMYLKRHHPGEFFTACLSAYDDKKRLELLRDAVRHKITVRAPDPTMSDVQWRYIPQVNTVLAGLEQIKGIGNVMAPKFIEHREKLQANADFGVIMDWKDYIAIKGVGTKTIAKIEVWCNQEDPFEIFKLGKAVDEVAKEIIGGSLRHSGIPRLTHTSVDVPYSRGSTTEVVWCGLVVKRNLKELFELHYSRSGETLDPDSVKDPELNEWVVLWGDDGTDLLTMTINRWRYPKFREAIWQMKLDTDMVVVKGFKPSYQSRRAIQITDMWILAQDEEETEEDDLNQMQ